MGWLGDVRILHLTLRHGPRDRTQASGVGFLPSSAGRVSAEGGDMGWLDRLLGRRREPDAERAEARTPAASEEVSEADVLEEEVAEARDKDALENPHPGVS
jgi:hypothetical protein